MFWLRPAPLWMPLVLFLISGYLHTTASINMNSPKKETIYIDEWGKERKLTGDSVRVLNKMIELNGLSAQDVDTLYSLREPKSIAFYKDDVELNKSMSVLVHKGYVNMKEGLWTLSYDGKRIVDSN